MLPHNQTNARTGARLAGIANRRQFSLASAFILATCLVATSGCVALSIPSKRFHDPEDHGGLFGDFRKGGSVSLLGHPEEHNGHFSDDEAVQGQCTEDCCGEAGGYVGHYNAFDDEDEFGTSGHGHQKPPEVPWPRYHPVPTRPVFSGYPGLQQ